MTVGILGYGNMGAALASGLRQQQPDTKIAILESSPARRRWAVQKLEAIDCGTDAGELCRQSDVLVLAISPEDLDTVAPGLAGCIGEQPVISILPNVTLDRLVKTLKTQNVCRLVPNLAAQVGEALVAISYPAGPSESLVRTANDLANAIGFPLTIPEQLIPAMTGLSGAGIAYLLKFIDAMSLGAVEAGMRYEDAVTASLQVLRGAAALIDETGEHPAELVSKAATPAGPGIAGLRVLDDRGFDGAVSAAVSAAAARARDSELK